MTNQNQPHPHPEHEAFGDVYTDAPHEFGEVEHWHTTEKLKPYPIDKYPDIMRHAIEQAAGNVQCPIEMAAQSALAETAACLQGIIDVRRRGDLVSPVSLYMLCIAESGSRKSTVAKYFNQITTKFMNHESGHWSERGKQYRTNKAAYDAKTEGLKSAIKDTAKKGEDTADLEKKLHELKKPTPVPTPKIHETSFTTEAIASHLSHLYPMIFLQTAEGGIVFASRGFDKESGNSTMTKINDLWSGGEFEDSRKTAVCAKVKNARYAIDIMVQPTEFSKFVANTKGSARGSGFLSRFLLCEPESMAGSRFLSNAPKEVATDKIDMFCQRVIDIVKQAKPTIEWAGDHFEVSPIILDLSPNNNSKYLKKRNSVSFSSSDAYTVWEKYHDDIEGEMQVNGAYCELRDFASKSADQAARIAALFEFVERNNGDIPNGISKLNMERGCALAQWYLDSALRMFNEYTPSQESQDAKALEEWLLTKHTGGTIERTAVSRNAPNRLRDPKRLTNALHVLTEMNRITVGKEGGKGKMMIYINPKILCFNVAK